MRCGSSIDSDHGFNPPRDPRITGFNRLPSHLMRKLSSTIIVGSSSVLAPDAITRERVVTRLSFRCEVFGRIAQRFKEGTVLIH
jgi:hypothetical protein